MTTAAARAYGLSVTRRRGEAELQPRASRRHGRAPPPYQRQHISVRGSSRKTVGRDSETDCTDRAGSLSAADGKQFRRSEARSLAAEDLDPISTRDVEAAGTAQLPPRARPFSTLKPSPGLLRPHLSWKLMPLWTTGGAGRRCGWAAHPHPHPRGGQAISISVFRWRGSSMQSTSRRRGDARRCSTDTTTR